MKTQNSRRVVCETRRSKVQQLYRLRQQLRTGRTKTGRPLAHKELSILRAREAALVEKRQQRKRKRVAQRHPFHTRRQLTEQEPVSLRVLDAGDVEKQELPGHDRAHDREQGREHGSENESTRATEASMVALLLEQTEHYSNLQRKKEYDDYTCHRILRDSRCRGVVDTKMVRGWIRHEAAWRGDRDVAAAIRAAVYRASDAGVVRLLPRPAPRGRLVLVFQKLTWTEMERSEAAHVFLESIGLGAASFDP